MSRFYIADEPVFWVNKAKKLKLIFRLPIALSFGRLGAIAFYVITIIDYN
ncbi:hypothetical protein [Sphaerospermopsis torques-reginae]|uniref:Uncharacterized protein n=1 Tax=Sphaerospermopsis torques-reginae ITEP-024 TaxID=984208 RepID=A0ABX8WVE8_9CYAN|nr:hypothetical protein [Sphaerospermopsis torques-reginae]QYX30393.1 hypothetical protein K2F26_15890 [Sphaerospermopsis torques-reginae ITEP-024]